MRLAWQQIPSPLVSEMLCRGMDGVVLDTEHGCYNNETLFTCIQVITASGKKCFVRLTEINKTLIRICLDAGITGLIFSTVETAAQAQQIQELCSFPKYHGRRGLGLVRENQWGYGKLVNRPSIIIAQIETKKGVQNLDKIHQKGFDYYMIGPYDLSASLGKAGDFECKAYARALEKIKNIIPIRQMAVHIPTDVDKQIKKYKDYGIIAVGMDTTILLEGYRELQ